MAGLTGPLRLSGPRLLLLVAMAGVLLPWLEDAAGSRIGIGERDGVLVLVVSGGAFVLVGLRIRAAWIAAGLGAAVALRDLLRVLAVPGTMVGLGLWLTAAALTGATVWLLLELARQVRNGRSNR